MASIVVAGDTSGSITLAAPAVAGSNTLTLPANTGTVITTASSGGVSQSMLASGVAGNGPAFSAYCSSGTSLSANTWTKQDLQTEEFDTNSNFASSRFTPTVAGYYQINGAFSVTSSGNNIFCAIYKNGSQYKFGNLFTTTAGVGGIVVVSSIVYCNGTTDYVELYSLCSASATSSTGSTTVYMNGSMVRAA